MGSPLVVRLPPPSLFDKFRRAVWRIAWLLFVRPSPVVLHAWRRAILRIFGARIENGAEIYPSTKIWAPWNLTMEAGSGLGPEVDCYCVSTVTLRAFANVSQRAFLCTASHECRERSFPLIAGPIEIGPGAWVAAEAFVGPGTSVGAHAVVAARAVVTRDVAENDVVAGNPARKIGDRYAVQASGSFSGATSNLAVERVR